MRGAFERKRNSLIAKRQDLISSDLSQSKSSLRETDVGIRNSSRAMGLRKALEQLQVLLEEEKERREELEGKISKLQLRTIERENEFRRIIEQSIPFCLKEKASNVLGANLKAVHGKIMDFFEITQQSVEIHLAEQQKWLQEQMQRKIQAITAHVEQDLEQHRRLQALNYETIHREISNAIHLSTSILDENQSIKRQAKQLEFTNQIRKEENELLIAEIIQKKQLILKMYSHLREKYSRDEEIDKEIAVLKRERRGVERSYEVYERSLRAEMDSCFKTIDNGKSTIDSIKPKAIRLFTTEQVIKPQAKDANITETEASSSKQPFLTPHRFYSTVDVKGSSSKDSKQKRQQRNALTQSRQSTEKTPENSLIAQLRQSLKREKRKTAEQSQRIEYLIGYKREIDLFVRECYRNGQLDQLSQDKIERLLVDLKKRIENENGLEDRGKCQGKDYSELLQA